jgi:enoyl-CoA hydratase
MAYQTINYAKGEGIGVLTLNRPRELNALSPQLCREAREALEQAAGDTEVRVVIITGGEKVFCAGADIKALQSEGIIGAAVVVMDFINWLEGYEKPVIAAVSGYALGGGCELAMVCDLRIASATAKFGVPEIKIGLFAGAGGTQRLPRLIGITKAKELNFLGDPIDAEEAYRLGLVNKVVPVESLMDETRNVARAIAERAPLSLRVIKKNINVGMQMDISSAMEFDRRGLYILSASEDAKEGISAFLEKRKPVFSGK